jgi:hypothetical protein
MDPMEIQARATIAAALIMSHAVEVPTIPTSGTWSQDTAAVRLRQNSLTVSDCREIAQLHVGLRGSTAEESTRRCGSGASSMWQAAVRFILCQRAVDSDSTPHHRMRIVLTYEFRAYPSILPLHC